MSKQISSDEARNRIAPGWTRLNELLAGVPEDRVEEPGLNEQWSVKVLLGHIAFWERNAARVIRLMADGQPLPPLDPDVINAEIAAADETRAYSELRDEFDQAHADLLAILDETGTVDGERLSWDTWDHYPEHIQQLEHWRQKT